ncbi:PrsW family intramembrane metalloprotease [Streptomyces sp. NPDC046985]|uniref:PrsW family intramembrane metalloprotease n=1 Tax=Streptomyces sp. NPDC046985 TaxID=3155377 RepID=UPI0033C69492
MASPPPYPTQPPAPVLAGGGPGRPHWWQRRRVRYGALAALLALSGLVILALVLRQTGAEGLLVGLGLAVLPVPLLTAAFRWLDRVHPGPWRNMVFAFAWGACAAALIALVANSFATKWIAAATADPGDAHALGATVIAPVVEESAKAAAVLLIFLFRRRDVTGVVDGAVVAGVTATGFAFTENILYLGTAFGADQLTGDRGVASVTAATFFVRVVMSPFAHPLFTVCTGIGFGLAALAGERQRLRRVLAPAAGLLLAMGMHAFWNGSSAFGEWGFFAVYGVVMLPAFGLLTWLVVWTRQRELRTVREELPGYAAAGWLAPAEPFALGSLRARRLARAYAAHHLGKPAARTVAQYEAYATSLAFLRRRGRLGRAGSDMAARERDLLHELWRRRAVARPALEHAARMTAPPVRFAASPWAGYGAPGAWGGQGGHGAWGGPHGHGAWGAHGMYGQPQYGVPGPYSYPYPYLYAQPYPGWSGRPGTSPGPAAAPGPYVPRQHAPAVPSPAPYVPQDPYRAP